MTQSPTYVKLKDKNIVESGRIMKAKISRLSKGIFDKSIPDLELSAGMIEGTVQTDGVLSGSFLIKSLNDLEAKGVLYTDSRRIVLKNTSFVGKQAEIFYEIHSDGMAAGEKIKGFIWVVSDGGELSLPCEVQVEAPYAMTSMGKLRNLFHFTNLVKNHYEEARRLFQAPAFAEIFLEGNPKIKAVYEGLIKSSCVDTAMEEFLVFINKKSRVLLTIAEETQEYTEFEHSLGHEITITKSSWGYLPIEVTAEGDFLRVSKKSFSSEDFTGSIYQLAYTIEESCVHAGWNYGRIGIRTPYQELAVEIRVKRKCSTEEKELEAGKRYQEEKEGLVQLAEQYFAFRMHKLNTDAWCKKSLKLIERLRSYPDAPLYLELVQIQLLLTQKKHGEAGFLLEHVEHKVMRLKEKQPELYAYYLYVRVLYIRDSRSVKETLLTVRRLYENGHDSWQILWVLLYLDEEYLQNKSLKLVQLKEQYAKGARSPFLYYEACVAMNEQPALIRVLNGFEQQAVWWGIRKGMLSEKTGLQIAALAQMEKRGTPLLYRILEAFYEKYKNKMILESLLSLMIRDGRIEQSCFPWYETGVASQCNLTGLYEAYLHTLPDDYAEPIPKLAAMYFAFGDGLNEEVREKLYENLLRYEQENASVLQNHLPSIEQFVLEQIEKGRINRRLAFIYKKIMRKALLNDKLAETYPRILLSCYVKLENKTGVVIVRHKECQEEFQTVLQQGGACVPVYTEDAAVLYEDMQGRRFLALTEQEPQPLFHEESMLRSCYEKNQGDVLLWLHICEKEGIYRTGKEQGIEVYKRTVASPLVGRYYKNQLYQKIIEYYMENYDGEKLEEHLKQLDMDAMEPSERCKMVELLIARAMYEEAYQVLKRYGYEELPVNRLMKLCIYLLWVREGAEDEFLLELCAHVFFRGKYDETVLTYLLKYYYSTTKNMLTLWQAAKDFSVDTVELEERLIVQMLFSGSYVARIVEVFEDYYQKSTNQMVIRAYLAQQSYEYFVHNLAVSDRVFYFVEKEYYRDEREVPDICRMALLRYYSGQEELSAVQIELARTLMQEFLKENKHFGFYKKFEKYMELPPILRDKTIIEYQSNTEQPVALHYMLNTGISGKKVYEIKQMEKSYASCYSIEMVLFYGEHLQYYITEGEAENVRMTESDTLLMDRFDMADGESRYHLLNDICACMEMRDMITLKELMQSYAEKKKLVENGFTLL